MQLVEADYSQFYIRGDDPYFHDSDGDFLVDTGLMSSDGHGSVFLVSFQQAGRIPIDIEVLPAVPPNPGPEWQDVVEITLRTSQRTTLSGWEQTPGDLPIPVFPEVSYRVRYAVADADLARERWEAPLHERYQIRLWPPPTAPPAVLRSESGAGQYWLFGHEAQRAYERAKLLPPGTRTRAMVDSGLRAHPDTAKRIARGEQNFESGS